MNQEGAWDGKIWEPLEGSIVRLELLEPGHEPGLFEAAQDPGIWRWLPRNAATIRGSFRAWLEGATERSEAGAGEAFAILSERGVPFGGARATWRFARSTAG